MNALQLFLIGVIILVGAFSFFRGGDVAKALTFVLVMALVVAVVVRIARYL